MTTSTPPEPEHAAAPDRSVVPLAPGDAAERTVDSVAAPEDGRAQGVRALLGDEFSVADAVGGVRGMLESVAPGLVFVVVFVLTRELTPSLVSSVAVTLVAVVVRLLQRTPVTQAVAGLLGVAIGVVWAWRSGNAADFFVWGLWTNAAYLAVLLVSLLVRWPLVGLVVEGFRSGFGTGEERSRTDAGVETAVDGVSVEGARTAAAEEAPLSVREAFAGWSRRWRSDRALMRRYALATWLWVGLFAVRLAVQVPLYLQGSVGWLGTARLVMGLPLWALVLWLTWALVRRTGRRPAAGPGAAG
ncbi:DUF3159 domain-containing protein [Cellulosimicrobium arenosum]|uniref:DUF3159 domain-containing protein n=1 Tax=Cellulosimicrobium arenosum TaxID=2708133 RepID=A0A927G6S1_9MICO|nr:DUF3159 domain-containing protein [Cellulosimicrobium arenosum]MBD8077971.1 DUF3159 domain-containing protein [Cellulosimicrobium arenosum]